jgi:hypothetical protein
MHLNHRFVSTGRLFFVWNSPERNATSDGRLPPDSGVPIMTPQECVLDAVLRAQGIWAAYVEQRPRDCQQTLNRLFDVLDDDKLMIAVNRLNLQTPDDVREISSPPTAPLYNRTSG